MKAQSKIKKFKAQSKTKKPKVQITNYNFLFEMELINPLSMDAISFPWVSSSE
jgi:hypothetical protein